MARFHDRRDHLALPRCCDTYVSVPLRRLTWLCSTRVSLASRFRANARRPTKARKHDKAWKIASRPPAGPLSGRAVNTPNRHEAEGYATGFSAMGEGRTFLHHCVPSYWRRERVMARAAMAAVSARRTVGPRVADFQPDWVNFFSSPGVHPPSGPMARIMRP